MYLCLDFGLKNIGLAVSSRKLAEPLESITNTPQTLDKLQQICQRMRITTIVIGLPEGKTAQKVKRFKKELEKRVNVPIVYQDETLSTKIAEKKLMEAKVKKKKRRGPKHKYAAAVILQEYLDHAEINPKE
jgi:putative Holliday junction resolvase